MWSPPTIRACSARDSAPSGVNGFHRLPGGEGLLYTVYPRVWFITFWPYARCNCIVTGPQRACPM